MDILSKSILDFPELRSLDYENSYYEKSLRELVGVESADKIMENLMVSGKIKKMPAFTMASVIFVEYPTSNTW